MSLFDFSSFAGDVCHNASYVVFVCVVVPYNQSIACDLSTGYGVELAGTPHHTKIYVNSLECSTYTDPFHPQRVAFLDSNSVVDLVVAINSDNKV